MRVLVQFLEDHVEYEIERTKRLISTPVTLELSLQELLLSLRNFDKLTNELRRRRIDSRVISSSSYLP